MLGKSFWTVVLALGLAPLGAVAQNSKDLRIAVVDVGGGAAVLFVTPEGKSLLVDAAWPPGMGGPRGAPGTPPAPSSADRIAAAAAALGVTKIDYLLMTHFHIDHLGGLPSLMAKLPVGTFIDHGPNREEPPADVNPRLLAIAPKTIYPIWETAIAGHAHITAKVGDKLNIGSMHIQFVTSDGEVPRTPLPGAGKPNALCSGVLPMERDGGEENARSVGMLITFGKTRLLDMGDLTWNKEVELLCPVNRIGKVDVYFVSGHGMDLSSSPPTAALAPIVAIMQNGPTKGGDAVVLNTVNSYPELEGLWKSHYSVRSPDLNGDPDLIANLAGTANQGYSLALDITPKGEIKVTNTRNQFSKMYKARAAR
jgi:competence protein ComEC